MNEWKEDGRKGGQKINKKGSSDFQAILDKATGEYFYFCTNRFFKLAA